MYIYIQIFRVFVCFSILTIYTCLLKFYPLPQKRVAAGHQLVSHSLDHGGCWNRLPSLRLTQSLKIDGWKTTYINYFPFGAFRPIFRCKIAVSFRENGKVNSLNSWNPTRSCMVCPSSKRSPNQDFWNPMIFMANLVWRASNKPAEWSCQIVEKILLATQLPSLKLPARENRSSQKEFYMNQPFIYRGYISFREGSLFAIFLVVTFGHKVWGRISPNTIHSGGIESACI